MDSSVTVYSLKGQNEMGFCQTLLIHDVIHMFNSNQLAKMKKGDCDPTEVAFGWIEIQYILMGVKVQTCIL